MSGEAPRGRLSGVLLAAAAGAAVVLIGASLLLQAQVREVPEGPAADPGGARPAGVMREVPLPMTGDVRNPVWSKGGRYLAAEVHAPEGGVGLFTVGIVDPLREAVRIDLPGRGGRVITINPAWHPAGSVLFEGSNSGGESRIYLYNPGGASATEQFRRDKAPGNLTFPVVSGDGRSAAFVSDAESGGVVLWTTAGGLFTRLTDTEQTESFPCFSPDSERLLFARGTGGTDGEDLFEVDIATKAEKSIVGGGGDQSRPVYAAGGAIVYFSSERGPDHRDLMTADGAGSKKALAEDVRLPLRSRPALTPDGRWVAWTSDDPARGDTVRLAKVDGSGTAQIQTGLTGCEEPAFADADGRVMLACTCLSPGDPSRRRLYVADVTDRLR